MRKRLGDIRSRIEDSARRQSSTSPANLPSKSILMRHLADDVVIGGSITVQDEGVADFLAAVFNFVGLGVTVTNVGGVATITIPGGGGGGAVATDVIWDALGDLIYATGPDAGVKLAGNTTALKKFLRQTGTGAVSAAPAWEVLPLFDAVATQILALGDAITVTDGAPFRQITAASTVTLTSTPTIAAGRNGEIVWLHNVGAFDIILQNITLIASGLRLTDDTVAIKPGATLELVYDSTLGAWAQVAAPIALKAFLPAILSFTVDDFTAVTHEVGGASSAESPTTHHYDLTYTGVPTACTVDIDGGKIGGDTWPVVVTTPFLLKTGANNFYRATTILGTRILTATATVSGQVKTKQVIITYMNNVFVGSNVKDTTGTLTEAEIEALLGKTLSNSKTGSFSVTGTNYIWYAYPSRLGVGLYFAINSERAGFIDRGLGVTVTNPSGFLETYQQWCSVKSAFGATPVTLACDTTQSYNNRRYWGPSTATGSITSAQILALDDLATGGSGLSNVYTGSFTVTVAGNEYVWFCYPSRITGTPVFKDHATGFPVAMDNRGVVSHTNDRGYVENYQTWQSTNKLATTLVMDVT